jgi:hypothetical protein
MLRLTVQRFGQTRPGTLEILADRDRRTPTTREATRVRYLKALVRVMLRGGEGWGEWSAEGFRTAMDIEKSFGPAYARGSLVRGQQAWAVIAVNAEETQTTIDGILTLGVLWLAHCRESAGGRRLYRGLRLIVPRGMATLTASRLAWMNQDAAQWELWEFDEKTEEIEQRDAADHGNLTTRLIHAPNETAARERFAEAAARAVCGSCRASDGAGARDDARSGRAEDRERHGDGVPAAWSGFCASADGVHGAELQPRAGDYIWGRSE